MFLLWLLNVVYSRSGASIAIIVSNLGLSVIPRINEFLRLTVLSIFFTNNQRGLW